MENIVLLVIAAMKETNKRFEKERFMILICYMGSVEDAHGLINTFFKSKTNIVTCCSAKHIDTGEKQPAPSCQS